MLRSPRIRARRSSPPRSAGAEAFVLTSAAALAGLATAAAVGLTPAAVAAPTADLRVAAPALALASVREEAPRASRSEARPARYAVQAPASEGPTVTAYGNLGLTAIAKPKPKPKPVVLAATVATGGSAARADVAPSAPAGGNTGSYAAAGAALGLAPSAAAVYSAIRSTFGITNIGGYRAGDWADHGTGHAVDVMITSAAQGNAVANYAIANMGRLNIKYIIWQQRIWMGSGWRLMEDRGSITQNHFDHVHISVN